MFRAKNKLTEFEKKSLKLDYIVEHSFDERVEGYLYPFEYPNYFVDTKVLLDGTKDDFDFIEAALKPIKKGDFSNGIRYENIKRIINQKKANARQRGQKVALVRK